MTTPSRPKRRALVIAAVAILTVLPARADATVARPAQTSAPRLELVEQTFAVEPDGVIRLRYRLVGIVDDALELAPRPAVDDPPTDTAVDTTVDPPTAETTPGAPTDASATETSEPPVPEPIALTFEVTNYQPLTDSDDVDRVVGSDVDPDSFGQAIDGVAIADVRERVSVAGDGTVEFTLEIPTDVVDSVEQRMKFESPGMYPLRVQLLVGDTDDDDVVATAGTIVQRLPGPLTQAPPPINLSVVTVMPAPLPRATPAEQASAQRSLDGAVELAAGLDAPVTLEVPPTLVAEQASTPLGAERLAQALSGDELVSLPLAALDVSSAVAVGRAETYTRLVNAGEELLTSAVPTTPVVRTVWMTDEPLSAQGAQQLRDLGTRIVIMPAALYRDSVAPRLPERGLFVDAELPDGATLPIMVVDPLSAELTTSAADEILVNSTPAEWSVQTASRILIDRDDLDANAPPARRSLILTAPDLATPDGRLLGALVELATTTPSLRFAAASSLIGVTDTQQVGNSAVTVTLPQVAGPSLEQRVQLIDQTGAAMFSAASMLAPDDPRPTVWSNDLDSLISTAYSDDDVAEVTTALLAEADALTKAVVLPEPFTFTLAGRNGTIEVRLGNTSSEPLNVVMQLDSSKVEFPDGDQAVTLRPNDETTIVVPVEARSNGTSPITLTVTTPAGAMIDEPVTLTSRVTGFTGFGQLLTGGFILILLTWWFSHWRAKRRAVVADDDGRDRHPTARAV